MSKVIAGFAMSLDGFIADAQDGVHDVFRWLMDGDTEFLVPGAGRPFKTSAVSAAHYREIFKRTGAHITGRRDFDVSRAWGGHHPMNVPVFIVTHHPPQEWSGPESPFTFVTDGVESAVAQARQAAGNKDVLVGGSRIAQQAIRAGLVDEIWIDLAPVLLGSGVRLFDNLGDAPIQLQVMGVTPAPGVTHLQYCIHRAERG